MVNHRDEDFWLNWNLSTKPIFLDLPQSNLCSSSCLTSSSQFIHWCLCLRLSPTIARNNTPWGPTEIQQRLRQNLPQQNASWWKESIRILTWDFWSKESSNIIMNASPALTVWLIDLIITIIICLDGDMYDNVCLSYRLKRAVLKQRSAVCRVCMSPWQRANNLRAHQPSHSCPLLTISSTKWWWVCSRAQVTGYYVHKRQREREREGIKVWTEQRKISRGLTPALAQHWVEGKKPSETLRAAFLFV